MRMAAIATMGLSALAALMMTTAAQSGAAPSGPDSVQDTVNRLESNGFKVILNKVGAAPLEQCTVSAVRPGREVTELRQNRRDQTVERVVYTTVHVDAAC
jgi:hypothetical protein